MTKMQINILEKNDYGFTLKGSKTLELIMSRGIPPVDLLVRESIQNSDDAVLTNKKCSKIYFDTGKFSSTQLANSLDFIEFNLNKKYPNSNYSFLSISDKNTCGLLGEADDEQGPNNHLYKLVYSFFESGKDGEAGGNFGLGKSVYYRYGMGMVFYYSRTFENGAFTEKLCGALIEDETSRDALLKENNKSTGIAFFGKNVIGKNGGERSIPINKHEEIAEFLDIFGLETYKEDETGTRIIIPFFDEEMCSTNFNNNDLKYWEHNFVDTLRIAIQRWYFPKIANTNLYDLYKRKFMRIYINKEPLFLNSFFLKLQKLYSGELSDAKTYQLTTTQGFSGPIGVFRYKIFTAKELGVKQIPENLPNPFAQVDLDCSDGETNQALIFYTRKPGMILNYKDSQLFTNLTTDKDSYLIGVFVLNDEASLYGETLGLYFKECEGADHSSWTDITTSKKLTHIPALRSKVFRKIQSLIRNKLNEEYGNQEIEDNVVTSNSALQKRLGEILLPSEDFGKEPSIPRTTNPNPGPKRTPPHVIKSKKSKIDIEFLGFDNGQACYLFTFYLRKNEALTSQLLVETASGKVSMDEWDKLKFELPCYLAKVVIDSYSIDKTNKTKEAVLDLSQDGHSCFLRRKNIFEQFVFTIKAFDLVNTKKAYSFRIVNELDREISMAVKVYLQPVNDCLEFSFAKEILENGGNK